MAELLSSLVAAFESPQTEWAARLPHGWMVLIAAVESPEHPRNLESVWLPNIRHVGSAAHIPIGGSMAASRTPEELERSIFTELSACAGLARGYALDDDGSGAYVLRARPGDDPLLRELPVTGAVAGEISDKVPTPRQYIGVDAVAIVNQTDVARACGPAAWDEHAYYELLYEQVRRLGCHQRREQYSLMVIDPDGAVQTTEELYGFAPDDPDCVSRSRISAITEVPPDTIDWYSRAAAMFDAAHT